MIEFLNALPADHAVKSLDWLDDFAIEAEILKINILIIPDL